MLVGAAAMVLAACTPSAPASPTAAPAQPAATTAPAAPAATTAPAAASGQPIKIGVPLDLTGNLATNAKQQQIGIEIAVQQAGGAVAGHPIQLVVADTQSTADQGLQITRRLVESDKVDAIVGYVNTATGYATRDYLDQAKKPAITMAAAAGLTRAQKSPYIFRMNPSTYQWAYAPSQYLKDKLGVKRIIFWGDDYAAPREGFQAVKAVFGDGVVKEIWTPMNTADYSPYLSSIQPGDADMLVVAAWGADAVRIADQYQRSGLRDKMPLYGYAGFTSDDQLSGFSPESINGVESAYVYCAGVDTPANKDLVAQFKQHADAIPGDYGYGAYLGMRMMLKAIESLNGDTSNPDKLVQALEKVKLEDTPTGVQSFDPNHGWVTDFFWRKAELVNGAVVNRCVDRLPQVPDPVKEFPNAAT